MFMYVLLFCTFVTTIASREVLWSFTRTVGTPSPYYYPPIRIDVSIGSPVQHVSLNLYVEDECSGLWVDSVAIDQSNGFNRRKSTTFEDHGRVNNSINATENFEFDYPKHYDLPFYLVDRRGPGCGSSTPRLNFANYQQNYFLNALFGLTGESVAAITYEETPVSTDDRDNLYGTLTLGGRPKSCGDWTAVKVSQNQTKTQWAFDINKISLGKFSSSQTLNAQIDIATARFELPYDIYKTIADLLDLYDYGEISCDVTDEIVFTLDGGFEFKLRPDDYIDRNDEENLDTCYFIGNPGNSGIVKLPNTLFRNRCLLFNFEKNQLEFANRTDKLN
ncbi:hypothetical protein M3Y97_01040700 [Aphelenchoides bicaudatus]|nr:hypothetical protein M3Y97_01040700 [Aphelenchoides bicaudatus]